MGNLFFAKSKKNDVKCLNILFWHSLCSECADLLSSYSYFPYPKLQQILILCDF